MKHKLLIFISILCIWVGGCKNQYLIEDVSLSLILGLDIDSNGKLQSYLISSNQNNQVTSFTIRESRDKFNNKETGHIVGSKIQMILLGENLINHANWPRYLDVLYRDPRNTVTSKVAAIKGSFTQLIKKKNRKTNMLLPKLIENSAKRNNTVLTTLHDLNDQIYDKSITPVISYLVRDNSLKINGSLLLNRKGEKRLLISNHQTKLLKILQNHNQGETTLTCLINKYRDKNIPKQISVAIQRQNVKINVTYKNQFNIDVHAYLKIGVAEYSPAFSNELSVEETRKLVQKSLQRDFTNFIKELQKKEVDPVGFGSYARAYTYPKWKLVQNNWGKAFSKAHIHVDVDIKVMGMGTTI